MNELVEVNLRYPIGEYEPQPFSGAQKLTWISDINLLPDLLDNAVHDLSETQLKTSYRDGGWTVQQVVHHIADSHMNGYVRFKLGLTEDDPSVQLYNEKLWAELADVKKIQVSISLTLLHALHVRWHETLKNITDDEWNNRTIFHPGHKKALSLWYLLGLYSWHGRHHVAHITSLRRRMEW